MYGISKSKMINPAHIVSIEYTVLPLADDHNEPQGEVIIQMTNQQKQLAFKILNSCLECERIISELIELVKRCNNNNMNEGTPPPIVNVN